jgi:hypothetical protein
VLALGDGGRENLFSGPPQVPGARDLGVSPEDHIRAGYRRIVFHFVWITSNQQAKKGGTAPDRAPKPQ